MGHKKTITKPPNPSGICWCGCGRKTPIAKHTKSRVNSVEGQHLRYCVGHGSRSKPYEPTPEEIREGCVKARERRGKHHKNKEVQPQPWEVPVIHIGPKTAVELNVLRIGRHGI